MTVFDQEYIEQRGRERKSRRFVARISNADRAAGDTRLERAGFRSSGARDYKGEPVGSTADVWLILAEKQPKMAARTDISGEHDSGSTGL